jgi:hypothetical protein
MRSATGVRRRRDHHGRRPALVRPPARLALLLEAQPALRLEARALPPAPALRLARRC